ncbi:MULTISPECIES: TRAP transporter small permease [unclassified Oceanobacter]|uniref:TRAP transporter small permease n=1 Tax=unclassified Oceanobacter TaxID=2620260 RepID=UPI0027323C4C|nr:MULTISPECIES: TRAP transporter small permease [unclassified Oceanobacter]MDP2505289.1 TRAP transporter small permease [Oceanobacter sp. 3_MG-2023]MDP2547963.1 TRAP transporter small permease [Oceanobacter sp. 4_MG-2023]MDP2609880.1 TRAP transporter small permease [Oceanobacter sp. 1_MG-2023]MDP2612242.1 TRAP transporter small permease [Oceanobacter sp. 2_MG-2023]
MKHSPLRRLLGAIHTLEDGILVLVLMVMVLLAGIDIVARSVFGGGIMWIPPALRVMVLWLGLIGGMVATRGREHIAIDLVNRLAPKVVADTIAIITSAFAAFICAVIAWYGYAYIELAIEFGDIAFANIPAWPLQLIIPFSFAVMALRFAIQSIESLLNILGNHAVADEAHS